ncbi:uncharacterized protein B0I36DRAFT_319455 [Microdochium trichocladiopsis]|uniref:Uncharacterized protein n=1 Tax=Microdochium trichocladiopsis TaxID=1682393 RepID=A0A9P8YCQ4_9PEZI|nr:uncharacterized protein B0I36DRAFT_319455 [Microdochium trichocladiopsis]KAH7035961.1 hypothetical protein B0I36DRAFT_319455 [Microdochium trichocladiopsis]
MPILQAQYGRQRTMPTSTAPIRQRRQTAPPSKPRSALLLPYLRTRRPFPSRSQRAPHRPHV